MLRECTQQIMLLVIGLVAVHGESGLNRGLCTLYQTSLMVYTYFYALVQRPQVYLQMTDLNTFLKHGAIHTRVEKEKTSQKLPVDRTISFQSETLELFLFDLLVIRRSLLGELDRVNVRRAAQVIFTEFCNRFLVKETAVVGAAAVAVKACESQPLSAIVGLSQSVVGDGIDDKSTHQEEFVMLVRQVFENNPDKASLIQNAKKKKHAPIYKLKSVSSTIQSIWINMIGTGVGQTTLLTNMKNLCNELINKSMCFRNLRLNFTDRVRQLVDWFI